MNSLEELICNFNQRNAFCERQGYILRTLEVISLRYWWAKMRQNIEEYVRSFDKYETRKGKHEFWTPLGEEEDPSESFLVISMGISGPYFVTPVKTDICWPSSIISQSMYNPSWSRTFRQKIVQESRLARHGSVSTLITDQGRTFTSAFFQETYKILTVRKVRTSA